MNDLSDLRGVGKNRLVVQGRRAVPLIESMAGSTTAVATDARAKVANALGLALAGQRAGALLDGADAIAATDVVRTAAHRGAPCVLHLVAGAPPAQAPTDGTGHEALHVLADAGALVLVARNVQEVVDLAMLARRVAETILMPVVVAMDREQTSEALQDIILPPQAEIEAYLGHPGDIIPSEAFVDRALFGEQRRRVPRWFDLERPVQWGSRQPGEIWGRSIASRHTFFSGRVAPELQRLFGEHEEMWGRNVGAFSRYKINGADTVLVVMGSAIETAETVCQLQHRNSRRKIGVLGVRSLQPFFDTEFAQILKNAKQVLVLERCAPAPGNDAPLMRQVRVAFQRNNSKSMPALRSVLYGMGGLPLRSADLQALYRQIPKDRRPQIFLGIDFVARTNYPKRQVLVDRIRRHHPEVETLGTCGTEPLQAGQLTLGLYEGQGKFMRNVASWLLAVRKGSVRGRARRPSEHAPQWAVERVTCCQGEMQDPGDVAPIDVAIVRSPRMLADPRWLADLAPEAVVLLAPEAASATLPVTNRAVSWHVLPAGEDAALLGALATTLGKSGVELPDAKRIAEAYRRGIAHLDDDRQEHLCAAFAKGMQEVRKLEASPETSPAAGSSGRPPAVRTLARTDSFYDSLPRFQDHIGVAYQSGDPTELTPDPYLALGAVPLMSTVFRDHAAGRALLPIVDTQACSGCGICWQHCPDGAIGAAAFAPASLVTFAMACAKEAGAAADSLQMIAAKLGTRIAKQVSKSDGVLTAGAAMQEGFAALLEKSNFSSDRRQALVLAADAAATAVDGLALVRCGGALLSVAIDPAACKACGLCIALCPEKAMAIEPQTVETLARARRHHDLHAKLPGTPEAIVQDLRDKGELEPLAALEFAEAARQCLVSGDSAEPGSGARLAVRSILMTAASCLAPQKHNQLQEIQELQTALGERIRKMLTAALPTEDLDALAAGLESLGNGSLELSAIASRLENATQGGRVDSARLGLFVDAARRIADLRWRLEHGINGFGRAPFSVLCIEGDATRWACRFPDNPFRVPVVVDSHGDAAALARGLIAGQMARYNEDVQELRHAQRALDRPNEAALDPMIRKPLTWGDLTLEEKRNCPPLVVIADEEAWQRRGSQDLLDLLREDIPLRVVVLTGLTWEQPDPGLAALVQRRAFVAQTSVAYPRHLLATLESAFTCSGSAWVRLHAPSPLAHGYPADRTLERAAGAVRSRALPLYRFDPTRDGVFGARLDLDDNPDVQETWSSLDESPYTFADWAVGEERFASHFQPLSDNDPAPVALADWLQLPAADRAGKTAFVEARTDSDTLQHLRVDSLMLGATLERIDIWRTLRELAGVVTPFTARVREEADHRAVELYEHEKKAIESRHQAQLSVLRREVEDQLVQRLENRLAVLAGYEELLAGGDV